MRSPRTVTIGTLAALTVAALVACQSPDVGQPCTPRVSGVDGGSPESCSNGDRATYFESGPTTACDNLVCIHSPGEGCTTSVPQTLKGLCSKPCISDADCFKDETGMVCRTVVLDPSFLATLPPDVQSRYLGEINQSSFCVAGP